MIQASVLTPYRRGIAMSTRRQGRPRRRRRLDVRHLFHRRARGTPALSRLRRRRSRRPLDVRGSRVPALARGAADQEGVRRLQQGAVVDGQPQAAAQAAGHAAHAAQEDHADGGAAHRRVGAVGAGIPTPTTTRARRRSASAIRLTAQMPTLVAAWERMRRGRRRSRRTRKLGLAANFLYMMTRQEAHRASP